MDDDLTVEAVHSDGNPPIPTVNMLMNYGSIPKSFEWRMYGRSAAADISGLNLADLVSAYAYKTIPDLFPITGYRNSSPMSILVAR